MLIVNKVRVKMAMLEIMIKILFPDGGDRQRIVRVRVTGKEIRFSQ